jgi:hypothetical protein
MRRWISVARHLDGDRLRLRAAFAGDPGRWLPAPALSEGGGRWTVTLRAGVLERLVACEVGPVRGEPSVCWRHVLWNPSAGVGVNADGAGRLALPRLEAELGLVAPERAGTGGELTLSGSYVPPYGVLGLAADVAALHHLAAETARSFLADLAELLPDVVAQPGRTAS